MIKIIVITQNNSVVINSVTIIMVMIKAHERGKPQYIFPCLGIILYTCINACFMITTIKIVL